MKPRVSKKARIGKRSPVEGIDEFHIAKRWLNWQPLLSAKFSVGSSVTDPSAPKGEALEKKILDRDYKCKGNVMSLSAPTKNIFLISVILAILAVVGVWVTAIPWVTGHAFIVLLIAYVVLLAGNVLKGI
jgi:hypothetical protein